MLLLGFFHFIIEQSTVEACYFTSNNLVRGKQYSSLLVEKARAEKCATIDSAVRRTFKFLQIAITSIFKLNFRFELELASFGLLNYSLFM